MKRTFANCFVRFGILSLFAIAMTISAQAQGADDADQLTFCSFGPKITVIRSKAKKLSDPCADKVHIQGVLWKCGSSEDVSDSVSKFLRDLNDRGREECRKHCERLGPECKAIYTAQPKCGLGTDREEAVDLGKQLGCRKDCTDGRAFTYCAIYNAGYQGPNPDAVRPQPANCECRSGS